MTTTIDTTRTNRGGTFIFLIVAALLALSAGCVPAAVLYTGPRYSRYDTALLRGEGTRIERVDGKVVSVSEAEVRPGRHTVIVRLFQDVVTPFEQTRDLSHASLPICFTTRADARYIVVPRFAPTGHWWPDVLDAETMLTVPVKRGPTGGDSCLHRSPPVRPMTTVGTVDLVPAARHHQRAGFALTFEYGKFWGGDDWMTIGKPKTPIGFITAGEGHQIASNLSITPFWIGDWVGLGTDVGFAMKQVWPAKTGDAPGPRYLATASMHILQRVSQRGYVRGRFGVQTEFHDSYEGPGALMELGLVWMHNRHTGLSIAGRYTSGRYVDRETSVDASSHGVVLGVLFYP